MEYYNQKRNGRAGKRTGIQQNGGIQSQLKTETVVETLLEWVAQMLMILLKIQAQETRYLDPVMCLGRYGAY